MLPKTGEPIAPRATLQQLEAHRRRPTYLIQQRLPRLRGHTTPTGTRRLYQPRRPRRNTKLPRVMKGRWLNLRRRGRSKSRKQHHLRILRATSMSRRNSIGEIHTQAGIPRSPTTKKNAGARRPKPSTTIFRPPSARSVRLIVGRTFADTGFIVGRTFADTGFIAELQETRGLLQSWVFLPLRTPAVHHVPCMKLQFSRIAQYTTAALLSPPAGTVPVFLVP